MSNNGHNGQGGRNERTARTEAIILRQQNYGEADRLLTIITPEYGKLRVLAKGVCKPGGRKTGHVELFARSSMLLTWGREIHTVSQAEMVESHLPLREDLSRAAYSNYVVELLDHFSEFEETNAAAFAVLNSALGWLCESDADMALITRYVELKLLSAVGFEPLLFRCATGQEDVTPQDQFFSVLDGGVVCPKHIRHSTQLIPLKLDTLKTLRYLQTRDYPSVKKLRLSAALLSDLEHLLQSYLMHILERRLRSVDFIRRLRLG